MTPCVRANRNHEMAQFLHTHTHGDACSTSPPTRLHKSSSGGRSQPHLPDHLSTCSSSTNQSTPAPPLRFCQIFFQISASFRICCLTFIFPCAPQISPATSRSFLSPFPVFVFFWTSATTDPAAASGFPFLYLPLHILSCDQ